MASFARRHQSAMVIQAAVRGLITRVHIVHGPRKAFSDLAETISAEINREANASWALEALTFRSGQAISKPLFEKTPLDSLDTVDNSGDFDLRATADLEEELRRVRSQLANRATMPGEGPTTDDDQGQRLMALWTGAGECMIVSENGQIAEPVFMAPVTDTPDPSKSVKFPVVFTNTMRIFAMTAFDPPGESRSLEENARENHKLADAILAMRPRPAFVWPSFGFDLREGWREDGFCLAFLPPKGSIERGSWSPEAYEALSAVVVALAKRFRQGAIFGYEPLENASSSGEPDSLVALRRTTIPCCFHGAEPEVSTLVQRVPRPDQRPREAPLTDEQQALLDRPWAGPAELLPGDISM